MDKLLLDTLIQLFERDLARLKEEIKLYDDETILWRTSGEIKNPAGNLCLHLCGNLQHYIGAVLGKSGYERNRDLEFSAKDISQTELIALVRKTKSIVGKTLKNLDPTILPKPYPEKVFDKPMTTAFFMVHLTAHLSYHMGQINYHRRLMTT
jgi:hypothetical protein